MQTISPSAPGSISILLVDVDTKNLQTLETTLDSPEYILVKAQSADEALMALVHGEFAAIVLDVQLPGLSGIELARLIKQREITRYIPILFLTAHYREEEDMLMAYGAGAVDYLTKPYNPAVLRSKIDVFVELFRKNRALAEANTALEAEISERKNADERFRVVVESAPNAMLVIKTNGVISLVNSQAEKLFGYTRRELLGKSMRQLISSRTWSFDPNAKNAGLTQPASLSPETAIRKNGYELPVEITLNFIESGQEKLLLVSLLDITQRLLAEKALLTANAQLEAKNQELQLKDEERSRRVRAEAAQAEAEAARERLSILAEASSVLACTFDPTETFKIVVQLVVERMADYCAIDIRDENGPPQIIASAHNRKVDENGTSLDEIKSEYPSQQSCIIAPLKARGRRLGTVKLLRDMDHPFSGAEGAMVEELAERAGLALDNARLYAATQTAREVAEAANAAKDRFLAMLSHELRTPLSPVLHAVTLLEEEECSPPVKETLCIIRQNIQLEARLIDDLLDIARIRNGKLQLQQSDTDAHELLHRALKICDTDIVAKHLNLKIDLKAHHSAIYADPARVQQIFWNIIANAVKFTPENGDLHISSKNNEQDNMIYVEIQDSGVGLEQNQLEVIFNAFEQIQSERSRGLGLGLSICKALTALHGGTIIALSDGAGSGTLFQIKLPLLQEHHRDVVRILPKAKSGHTRPLKLLVVEDHKDTAATLCRLLIRRGYEVRSADCVEAAKRVAEEFAFDVVVSDIGLPDGTGVELFEYFKAQSRERPIHGIALSGYGMEQDLERSKSAGFVEHLTKPVNFAVLENILISLS